MYKVVNYTKDDNMLPEYRTIYRGGEDEIVEKKSRFIATVVPVNTEEEALEFVEKTRKKILGMQDITVLHI